MLLRITSSTLHIEPDACKNWPENYFEKYDEPNVTLVNEMYKYGRKNLALVHILIQSPYVTKIRRDIAMTLTTYVANAGGLLGLCIGFSFMSGIEIVVCLCWFCREFKKKACSKQKRLLNVQLENYVNQKDILSSEKQNSITLVEEELHQIAILSK